MSDHSKKKYYSFSYESLPRWSSYWYQIHEVLSLGASSVLEIGVGNGVVTKYLKGAGLHITTLDVDKDLEPDVVASVTDMPLSDGSHDVVLAAQVLEHLSFEEFAPALAEIHRVAGRYAVISLPHWGSILLGIVKLPLLPWLRLLCKLPSVAGSVPEDTEHRWEIGRRGYPLSRVKKEMRTSGFDIVRDYIIVEYPYHHFFVLKKK